MFIVKLIFLSLSFFIALLGIDKLNKLPDEINLSKKEYRKKSLCLYISCFYDIIMFYFLGSYLSPLNLDVGFEFFLIVIIISIYAFLCYHTIYKLKHRIKGYEDNKYLLLIIKVLKNTIFFKALFIFVEIVWLGRNT